MAKIAIITDTHIGIRNDSIVFHEYFKQSISEFFTYIDAHAIRHVLHLGDLFDRRKYVNFLSARLCREAFLEPLEQRGIETHIICGNHDVFYKDTNDVNALSECVDGRYKNIKTHLSAQTINVSGLDICLVPWINDTNHKESFDEISTTKAEICMGHLELNGFKMFGNVVSDHGDDPELFKRFDLVFSGHYHHKSSQGNIHYLGAFGEFTWADFNDPRGFTVFDTDTREFEFIRNPHRMFQMLAYDDIKHQDILTKIQKTDYSKYANTYVKVVCVNRTNNYAFDLLLDKLYKVGPIDISVIEDVSALVENDPENEINEAEDTITILDKYITGLTLPVNSDKMKAYMRDVYNEALSVEYVD